MKKTLRFLGLAFVIVAMVLTLSLTVFADDSTESTPTKGYTLYIYNADGTVGMDIDGTKSASDFSLKSAIEGARTFVDNAFLFGIQTPVTYVIDMYEDSYEDESFEIGADVTINGNGFSIVKADGVEITVADGATLNDVKGLESTKCVAAVNGVKYETLEAAINAIKTMTGDVTVEIYDKVTLNYGFSGSFTSIKFVGKTENAEIYLDPVGGYAEFAGKNIAFADLTLSKAVGGYVANAGFRNLAFGIFNANNVTYTNCVFANGAYAEGNVTFEGCTFYRSHDRYGLWAYNKANVTIDGCTFADFRGIKMYSEGAFSETAITVKNTNFSAVNNKPAIVLTHGLSVVLENNVYSETGVFELDLDGKPNGVSVTSDVAPTCKNDDGACGVLVDGKIYTTVAQAAEVATEGSVVTLLYNSSETVEFEAGVELNKNGFAANGVTVAKKGLEGSGTEADPFLIQSLEDLIWFRDTVNTYTSDGSNQFKGKYVKLTTDIDLAGINWTPIGDNSKNDHEAFMGTFDGDGHTIYNLYVYAASSHLGFFARTGSFLDGESAVIKNITFENVDVASSITSGHGGSYVGGVVANAGGNSVISNVKLTGYIYVEGYGYVGGIVGHGYPTIDNCSVTGADDDEYRSYIFGHYWCVGGIIGYAGEDSTVITNSSVSNVDLWTAYGAGGAVAGLLNSGNKLENISASNVSISTNSDYCMGYIAGNGEESTLTNITANNVTATAPNGNPINATDAVATINGAPYFDIYAAVKASNGETVKLLSNIELATRINIGYGETVVIDLNGKTVNGVDRVNIAIMSYGNLTIKDTSAEQNGVIRAGNTATKGGNTINICAGTFVLESGNIYSVNNCILIDEEAAEVTIKGGTITAEPNTNNSAVFYISSTSSTVLTIKGGEMVGYNGILLWNNTVINIEGGSIVGQGRLAIQGNGSKDNTEINISGGTITGKEVGIYHPQGGELNITGGTITGETGIVVKGGKVTISGGTINATGASGDYTPVNSGFKGTGDALYVEHYDNSTNSENYGTPVVVVNGGTFISANGKAVASYANPAANVEALSAFVAGGTFSNDVTALCVEGFAAKENENGTYGIVEVAYVAEVNGVKYETLQAAINAAKNGETVNVLCDIELDGKILVAQGTNAVLDLNGFTVSYKSNVAGDALMQNCGTLEIVNGTIAFEYVGAPDTTYSKGNYTISNQGKLTVGNGATILNTTAKMSHACYTIDNNTCASSQGAELIVNEGATIINENNYAVRQFAGGTAANKITVNGGIIKGTRAVWMQAAGSDTTVAPIIELAVNGGTLEATGESSEYKLAVYSYSYGNSLANTKIAVSGGTIKGDIALTGGKNKTTAETVVISGGIFEGFDGDVYSYAADETAKKTITVTGGTFTSNYPEMFAVGYKFVVNANGTYSPKAQLPTADVNNLGQVVISDYLIYDLVGNHKLTEGTKPIAIPVTMQFIAKDTAETAAKHPYANYTTDYYITIAGPEGESFVGNGCYLAGYYEDFNEWVIIPLDGFTVEYNKPYSVITSVGFNFTYKDICTTVRNFKCGMALSEDVVDYLASKGYNSPVSLDLGLAETMEKAQNAEYETVSETTYTTDEVTVKVAKIGNTYYTSYADAFNAAVAGNTVEILVDGDFEPTVANGLVALKNFAGNYVVGVKPTATVNNLGSMSIPAGGYGVWDGKNYTSKGDTELPLSFVMQFIANETADAGKNSAYADWYADFVITFDGIENGSFIADGCYLAGYYGSFGWVKIPVDGMKIEDGVRYPVMLGVGLGQKYDYICSGVETFQCALYIPDSILEANPNLKVNLELSAIDNMAGEKAAAEELTKTDSDLIFKVESEDYENAEFIAPTFVAEVDGIKYGSFQTALANANGKTIKLLTNVTITSPIVINKGETVVIDLAGRVLDYNSTTINEAMITNRGTLTINDTVGNGEIYYNYTGANDPSYGKGNYTISNGGTLTVNGGKIHIAKLSAHAKYPIDNNSTSGDAILVINGGHLYNYNTSAIRQFCNSTTYANSVTINGGVIEGYSAIWVQNPGKQTVNGNLTINGGEIKSTAKAYVEGTAALNEVGSNIYFTIAGEGGAWSESSSIAITGGTINENVYLAENAPADYTIGEATFNGRLELPVIYVAKIGDTYYTSYADAFNAAVAGNTVEILVDGDFEPTVANGLVALKNFAGNYVVGVKPTATVNNLGSMSIPAGGYGVWDGKNYTSKGDTELPLSFVMQFIANETADAGKNSAYADWYADFVITFDGIENGSFIADGCYLAGYYGSFGWVKIPVDGMKIEDGVRYPVMLGVGLGQKYDYICSGVETFQCALYIPDSILEANPNLKVNLELSAIDNMAGEKAAAEELTKTDSDLIFKVESEDYENAEFIAPTFVAEVDGIKYGSFQTALANANGKTIKLLTNVTITSPIVINKGETVVIDLAGRVLDYNSTTINEAMITNRGTLTINDTVGNGEIYYNYTGANDPSYGKGNYTISNGGTLTVNGGKIHIAKLSAHAKYPIDNNSTSGDAILVINGGHLYNYNTSAIRQFCNSTTYANSVTINGGVIEGYSAIWVQNPGKQTVNGNLTINGGEIKSTAKAYVEGTAALNEVGSNIYFTIAGEGGAWSESSSIAITGGTFNENVYLAENAPADYTIGEATFNGRLELPANYVAEVDGVKYTSLADAIANANGKTVKLLANINLASDRLTIKAGNTVTIDLNGFIVSGTCDEGQDHMIMVENTAKLVICDSSATQTGKLTYAQGASNTGWAIDLEGELVLESGTIELTGDSWSIGYAVDVRPNAWGTAYTTGTVFTMKGGKIVSSDGAIRVASSSSDTYTGVSASFVMNGGEIEAKWDGIFIQQSNTIYDILNVQINNGKITSALAPIRFFGPAKTSVVGDKENPMTLAINGGTFACNGDASKTWIIPNVIMLGGGATVDGILAETSFTKDSDVTLTAPEGYEWSTANGVDTLVEATYVAEVNGVKYTSLADAIANANGKIVVILEDIALADGIVVSKGTTVTIDLNGKTISRDTELATSTATITNNGNLTIQDTIGGGKITAFAKNPDTADVPYYANNTITNCGTLTILGGTIENSTSDAARAAFPIDNNSTSGDAIVYIKGGVITGRGAIRQFANSTTYANKIVISGGEVIGASYAIWTQNPGSNDPVASFEISNGTVGKILMSPSAGFTASITGGTVKEIAIWNADTTNTERNPSGFVSGGTFLADVSDFCADGYECVANQDGTYGIEKIEVPAVKWVGATITMGSDLKMNFIIVKSSIGDFEYVAKIVKTHGEGCTSAEEVYELDMSKWKTRNEYVNGVLTECYVITVDQIAAKEMNCKFTVSFVVDGEQAGEAKSLSVVQYATWVIKNYNDANAKTTMVDLLNYGAAAQVNFNHYKEPEHLANYGISEYQHLATKTKDITSTPDSSKDGAYVSGVTVEFEYTTFLNFYFTNLNKIEGLDKSLVSIVLTYKTHQAEEETVTTLTGDELLFFLGNDNETLNVKASVTDLAPADINNTTVKCDLMYNGNVISTISSNLSTYFTWGMGSTDANFAALCDAIMKYATSAYNYFH